MGHDSMIAFGIAQADKDKRVVCIDGDGAALMHMGAMTTECRRQILQGCQRSRDTGEFLRKLQKKTKRHLCHT